MGDFLLQDEGGAEVRVSEDDAYRGIAEGRLRPLDRDVGGGTVRVVRPDGRAGSVPLASLQEAIRRGYRFDTEEQAEDRARGRELSRELGPLEAPLASAAGVLRGGSMGGTDLAIAGVDALTGGSLADDFRVLQDRNPVASTLGEVAGAVGPAVVAPETLLGRAITAPTRAVAGLSGAAGAATRGALGSGILGRAAGGLAAGAIEGMAGSGAMLLTDAALGRSPEMTAESIIQDVGFGGLLGGALGGTLGAGSGLARAGGRMGRDAATVLGRRFLDETGERLHPTVARWWGALSGAQPGDLISLTQRDSRGIGARARRYILDGEAVASSDVAAAMQRARAGEIPRFSPRSFSGGDRARAAEAVESVLGRGSRTIVDDGGARTLVSPRAPGMADTIVEALPSGRRAGLRGVGGTQVDDRLAAQFGDTVVGAPAVARAGATMAGDTIVDLASDAGASTAIRLPPATLEASFARLLDAASDPAMAADAIAALTNRDIFGSAADAYRAYRSGVDGIAAAVDEAAELAARRRALEAVGGNLTAVAEAERTLAAAAEAAQIRAQWNRVQRVGRRIGPEASIMGRAILGHVVGGPVAAGIGAAAGVASQPAIAIRLLGSMEALGARLEGRMADMAQTVTSARTAARRASYPAYREALKVWREEQRRLDELRPDVLATRLGEATAQFGPEADQVRAALQTRMVQIAGIRRSIMPAPVTPAHSLTPHLAQIDPNPVEIERFGRLSSVLDDPLLVLERVADGTVQPDEVALMRAAYPATYEAIVGAVTERLTMLDREPSYEHRMALSILLGVPTDPTLSPEFMSAVQTAYLTSGGQDPQQQIQRPQRPMRADTRPQATEMQELNE